MNMATVQHHSYMKSAVVDFCVQVGSPLAPVTEYVAPAPAVALSVPSQQLRPATVATGVNLDVTGMVHPQFSSAAVEGSASQVVGSLSLGEVFAAPVFNQVHQEQLAGGEAFSRVAHSLPPEEFTEPVYSPVHQEQFSAGDTTENIVNFPVVQEQVLVQAIPRLVGSSPPVDEFTAYVAMRPLPLVEVQPSVRAQRHAVDGLGEFAPMVQTLDVPVPQMEDQFVDNLDLVDQMEALRLLDRPVAEQVIAMPTVSCSSCPLRSRVPEPQLADQLVEVPTVLTPTRIALQIAEQIVATPVPHGQVHGSLPGQSSSSRREDERAEVPKIRLLLRMGTDSMRYRVSPTQPLRFVFRAYCRRLGLHESQVRFYCDGLLSPEHSPDLLGLEDGDVIEAEEVFVEDEEEEEDDDDHDEFDGTESRFPDGFLTYADVSVVPFRELPARLGVHVRSLCERAAPPVSRIRFVMFFYSLLFLAVNCSTLFVPEEYLVGFFMEISSGIVSVCYTPWLANGYMFCVSL